MSIEKVEYRITAQDTASAAFKGLKGTMGDVQKSWMSLRGAFAGGAAGAAVATVLANMVRELREAETASTRFNAVLRATGNTAGLTGVQLKAMADEIEDTSLFNGEDIQSAQTNLLKFQNIHGQVFREAMALSADYAALTGSSMEQASQSMGRALQSPLQGLRLLERELGQLSPAQERSIRAFMEQGRMAEAQAVVLDFVRSKIQGTAAEMNTGLNGAVNKLQKNWGDMLKAMGNSGPGEVATRSLNNVAQVLGRIGDLFDGGLMNNIKEYGVFLARLNGLYVRGHPGNGPVRTDAGWGGSPSIVNNNQSPTEEQLAAEKKALEERIKFQKDFEEHVRKGRQESMEEYANNAAWFMQRTAKDLEDQRAAAAERKAMEDDLEEHIRRGRQQTFEENARMSEWMMERAARDVEARKRLEEKAREEEKKRLEESTEYTRQAARNMQDAMGDTFFDVMEGRTDRLGDRFASMLKRMAAEMAAADFMKLLVGDYGKTGKLGGIGGGIFGGGSSGAGSSGGGLGGIFDPIKNFFGFADGGVMTSAGAMPLRRYAAGGVTNSPQLAMFGEGSQPEAYVPLPDGRRIPVAMQGGGGNVVYLVQNIHVDSRSDMTSIKAAIKTAGTEAKRQVLEATRRGQM